MERGSSKGFTLAELALSLGLFAVVSLFLIGLVTSTLAARNKSTQSVNAAHLAQAELDIWKARPYGELALMAGGAPLTASHTIDGYEYETAFSVEPLGSPAPNPDGRVLRLTTEVTWREKTVLGAAAGTSTERSSCLRCETLISPGASL